MNDRVNDQINWYDNKSTKTQKKFKFYKVITIIVSSLIPVVSIFVSSDISVRLIIGSAGAIITILESVLYLNKYGENWTRYRSICETLKREKFMYLNKAGVYSEDNGNFEFFVERIETIISQENINWASLNKDHKKKG